MLSVSQETTLPRLPYPLAFWCVWLMKGTYRRLGHERRGGAEVFCPAFHSGRGSCCALSELQLLLGSTPRGSPTEAPAPTGRPEFLGFGYATSSHHSYIPCLASEFFHRQFPAFSSLCLKDQEWFLFSWLDSGTESFSKTLAAGVCTV